MLGLAAGPLGLRCTFVDPSGSSAAAAAVGPVTTADLADLDAVRSAGHGATVATYEWEGVPAATVRALSADLPVRPAAGALDVASDRLAEKTLFRELGIPVAPNAPVADHDDLTRALDVIGVPAILKTRRDGYDGKGQWVLRSAVDAESAWPELGGHPLILEGMVPFTRELSVLAARGLDGATCVWPVVQNLHVDRILRVSRAPAPGLTDELQSTATSIATRIMEALDYVGVIAVELFEREDGALVANELAPRVHNSGHWTIEGSATSQFEQHLRAITGRELGSTEMRGHAVMVNCLGEVPPAASVLAIDGAHLHDYGKEPRPGRKLGHITILAASASELDDRLTELDLAVPGLVPR
jgi:5-(carboxyamino)imidazole ribonucleotide synthase